MVWTALAACSPPAARVPSTCCARVCRPPPAFLTPLHPLRRCSLRPVLLSLPSPSGARYFAGRRPLFLGAVVFVSPPSAGCGLSFIPVPRLPLPSAFPAHVPLFYWARLHCPVSLFETLFRPPPRLLTFASAPPTHAPYRVLPCVSSSGLRPLFCLLFSSFPFVLICPHLQTSRSAPPRLAVFLVRRTASLLFLFGPVSCLTSHCPGALPGPLTPATPNALRLTARTPFSHVPPTTPPDVPPDTVLPP